MPLAGPLKFTRAELAEDFGTKHRDTARAITEAQIDAIEAKQVERNPNWKPGDKLLVHFKDLEEAVGLVVRWGDF